MDIIAVVFILVYAIIASWHGNIVSAAEWNAKEMEAAVWVILAVFFLWLLHGIKDIQKPVTVFIAIVAVAIALTQYQNVSNNLQQAWAALTGGNQAAVPSLADTGATQQTAANVGGTAGP